MWKMLGLVALPWAFSELIVLSATVTKAANNTVAAIMNDICFCITLYDGATETSSMKWLVILVETVAVCPYFSLAACL